MKRLPTTKRVIFISFFVDVADCITNTIVASMTGSAVIYAEAVQGLIDSVGSLLLIIGYRRANRPNDKFHPFGYKREVFFWALLSSMVMLFFGSGLSIWQGILHIQSPHGIIHKWLALGILLFSTLTNGYSLSQSIKKLSTSDKSFFRSFNESGHQLIKTAFLRDSLGTLSAFIGLVALLAYYYLGILYFDGIGAIFIGILMACFAIILISQANHLIVGQSVSQSIRNKILKAVEKIPEVLRVNRLAAVYIGSEQILVDIDVDLKEKLTTVEIEHILDRIKEEIVEDVPETLSVQIDLNSPLMKEKVQIERITSL